MATRKKSVVSEPVPEVYKKYQLFLQDGRTAIVRTTYAQAKSIAEIVYNNPAANSTSKTDGHLYAFRSIVGIVEVEEEPVNVLPETV